MPSKRSLTPSFSIFGWSPISAISTACADIPSKPFTCSSRGTFGEEHGEGTLEKGDLMRMVEVMKHQERLQCYQKSEYLPELVALNSTLEVIDSAVEIDASSSLMSETQISPLEQGHCIKWRKQMSAWAYDAAAAFGFHRDVVEVSYLYLDRYLCSCTRHSKSKFEKRIKELNGFKRMLQLSSMTSLYVACKMHNMYNTLQSCQSTTEKSTKGLRLRQVLSIDSMVIMSKGSFTRSQFQTMECDMLTHLDYRLNPPTAISFVSCILEFSSSQYSGRENRLHPVRNQGLSFDKNEEELLSHILARHQDILEKCRYYIELAVGECSFCTVDSSVIAVASILIAINEETTAGSTAESLYDAITAAVFYTLDNYSIVKALSALKLHPDSKKVMTCGKKLQVLAKRKANKL